MSITTKKPFLTKQPRSKNWYIVSTNQLTKKRSYKSTGTDDKETAERLLKELEMSLGYASTAGMQTNKVKEIVLSGIKHTTGAIIQIETPLEMIWIEYQRNERTRVLKPASIDQVRRILNVFIHFLQDSGVSSVEQISYDTARTYLDSVRARGCSDGTITIHRHALHGVFARVKRPLNLSENPFTDVAAPFRPKRKSHRCFSPKELTSLMYLVDKDWKILILLAYFTGLRFGDCCLFKISFIEWDKDIILITPEKTERFKKELIIPLHPTLKNAIQSYTNTLSGYLIPNFAELKRKKCSIFFGVFGKMLKTLKLEKCDSEGILDFHSLRHTFNTALANGDVDVATRMKLTGHSSIKVNQIYNHAIEPLKQAIDCIPEIEIKER